MPPRVAIIRGLRTPFAKSGTVYARLTALDLGKMAVSELIERSGIDPKSVQEVVFGNVIPSVKAPNIAREIVLGTGLPRKIPGYTIGKACASANQAITSAADLIFRGYADTVIAGGAESLSDVPILFSKNFAEALVGASKQKSVGGKVGQFTKLRPKDVVPDAPAIAESTTGLTMGESAEKMAKENGITREAQDEFALQSHQRAAAATASGRFKDEVMTVVVPPGFDAVSEGGGVVELGSGPPGGGPAPPRPGGASAVLGRREEKERGKEKKP